MTSLVDRFGEALKVLAGQGDEAREDGFFNSNTGLGTASDRAAGMDFSIDPFLDVTTLAALFHFNDICRTIISIFPEEALRRPWEIKGPDKEALDLFALTHQLAAKIERGAKWGRCFGGGLGVLQINDGQPSDQPLIPGRAYKIRGIDIYDRRSVMREARFDQPTDLLYADAKIFEVFPPYGGSFRVHRDRCLVFGGVETADYEREMLAGWDASALQAPYNVVSSFESGYLSLSNMLTDASQAVITMKGFLSALTQKGGTNLITTRAAVINLTRSVARAIFLDSDGNEKFEKVSTAFSGIPDSIDRLGNRLSAATRIPVTILMGQAPAGLNATGDSDTRAWYAQVESYRGREIAPHLERIIQLLAPGRGNKVVWPSLWQPSDKEAATTRLADAQADKIYLDDQVVTPEEVALTRDGTRDIKIDRSIRRALPVPAPALGASGKPKQLAPPAPASPVTTGDADVQQGPASTTPTARDNAAALATKMSEHAVAQCEHGKSNRCWICGIERARDFVPGPDGSPAWSVGWQPIADGIAEESQATEPVTTSKPKRERRK